MFSRMLESMQEKIHETIISFFMRLAEGAIEIMLNFVTSIHSYSVNVLEYDYVLKAIIYTQILALTLLALKIAFESLNTYILRVSGDPNADPGGLLIRGAVSTVMICGMPWIPSLVYNIGVAVSRDISNLPGNDLSQGVDANPLISIMADMVIFNTMALFIAIAVLFAVIIVIVVFFQMMIRTAELAIVCIIGPIMSISLNSEMFGEWWKKLISLVFSQAVQILMLRLSFYVYYTSLLNFDVFGLSLFIGFLWATVKSPKILEQFVQSTGVGRVAAAAGQMVVQRAMLRKMFTRGV